VDLANLGSVSKSCVGSRVHLVRASISFEKNLYRLPFTPPSLALYQTFNPLEAPSLVTLPSLIVFFEHTLTTFAAYDIPRRLSSFHYLTQHCGEESSSSNITKVGANITKKKLEKRATRGNQPHIIHYRSFSGDV
jgi:hypothetical protein